MLTLELDDQFDAIQVGIVNQFTSAWGLTRVVVAPSASYGGDPTIGAAAYDTDGRPLGAMLPVQWSNGGDDSAAPGTPALSLPLAAAAAGGQTTLPFTSTAAQAAYGGESPRPGWFVADGLGCVPPGATVSDVDAQSVTVSAPLTAAGCRAGQAIYFSPGGFGPFGRAVPAAASFGSLSVSLSDWLPLRSLPRTDGGFAIGASVSGPGIADATTLAGMGYNTLVLSQPLAADLPARTPLAISVAQSVDQDAEPDAYALILTDTRGVRPGQLVTGSAALLPGTHVADVRDGIVSLDRPLADTLAAGTSLGFAGIARTTRPASAGATTLAVPSTSNRPLLHLRYFTQAGYAPSLHRPQCMRNTVTDALPCEGPLGLAPVWSSAGGETPARLPINGVDFVSQIGAGAGGAVAQPNYPSLFVRYRGRHAGATLLICGGFQSSGATGSVSGEASPGRIAAAWATTANPAVPVTAVSAASRQLTTTIDFENCNKLIDLLAPTMVLIQDYSNHNYAQVAPYRDQVHAVADHALAHGVQPIIYLAYVEAGPIGALTVASDVSNATTVPLLTGLNATVAGPLAAVTGPGIAAGTTASAASGDWSLVLSQPATIAAGTVLHLGLQVGATDGTALLLGAPAFLSTTIAAINAPGVPPGTTVRLNKGSYSGTLNRPASLAAGDTITLANTSSPSSVKNYGAAALWFRGAADPWDAVQLDALAAVSTGPANANWMCDGCTTQGAYANDYGNMLIAGRFVPLLQSLTGQEGPDDSTAAPPARARRTRVSR